MREIEGAFVGRSGPFRYYDEQRVRVYVIDRKNPVAIAYPSGTIFVSTGLVAPSIPHELRSEAQILGLLANRVEHLASGYALDQWVSSISYGLEYRRLVSPDEAASDLERPYVPGRSYFQSKAMTALVEYLSDGAAVAALDRLNEDPLDYLAVLKDLLAEPLLRTVVRLPPGNWLQSRVDCLRIRLANDQKIEPPRFATGEMVREHPGVGSYMSPEERHLACAFAKEILPTRERESMVHWLNKPDGYPFTKVVSTLPRSSRRSLFNWIWPRTVPARTRSDIP